MASPPLALFQPSLYVEKTLTTPLPEYLQYHQPRTNRQTAGNELSFSLKLCARQKPERNVHLILSHGFWQASQSNHWANEDIRVLHMHTKACQLQPPLPAKPNPIRWLLVAGLVAILAGCGNKPLGGGQPGNSPSAAGSGSGQIVIAGPLTDAGIDLHAGAVEVPLELKIPSLAVSAAMVGVGLNAANLMDAPKGAAGDPMWQEVFWYRGSGIPGASGTATMAGHVNDMLGQPAVFARLKELRPGDAVVVHDKRTNLDIRFTVMKTETYSLQQSADPAVLALVYGDGPLSGKGPQPAADGRSHLTLVTCDGDYVNGSYDHHLVVYAERSD